LRFRDIAIPVGLLALGAIYSLWKYRRFKESTCSSWSLSSDGSFHATIKSGTIIFKPKSLTSIGYDSRGLLVLQDEARMIVVELSGRAETKQLLDKLRVLHPGATVEDIEPE
jgi:hypothetical protein